MKPLLPRPTTSPNLEAAAVKTSLQLAAEVDDVVASPWIGLHYKHEFLLHHRHESLEPALSSDKPNHAYTGGCGPSSSEDKAWRRF